MRQQWRACREAVTNDSNSPRVHRHEGQFFTVQIKPPRCTPAELLFFCCDSVAVLPALANCNGHVAKTHIS
jgi:hypothetical protein